MMIFPVFSEETSFDFTDLSQPFWKDKSSRFYLVQDDYFITLIANKNDSDFDSLSITGNKKIKYVNDRHYIRNDNYNTDEKDFYIFGKGIIVYIEKRIFNAKKSLDIEDVEWCAVPHDETQSAYSQWKKYKEVGQYYEGDGYRNKTAPIGRIEIYDSGIKRVYSSSFLSEKVKNGIIKYEPINIADKLYFINSEDFFRIKYDSITPPWVEGKKDYGIGEYLDIEFKWPADEMQILNGFVDFTRMDLYEKNSRVKTVLIESENPRFSKMYELEDLVKYSLIKLPQRTDKIRMTIKDVYPGTKYKDTCLSSILVTNPNLPDYEEMKAKILKAMKEGVIDRRYDKSEPLPDFIKVSPEK